MLDGAVRVWTEVRHVPDLRLWKTLYGAVLWLQVCVGVGQVLDDDRLMMTQAARKLVFPYRKLM